MLRKKITKLTKLPLVLFHRSGDSRSERDLGLVPHPDLGLLSDTVATPTARCVCQDLRSVSFGNVQQHKEVVRVAGFADGAEVAILLAEVPHTISTASHVGAGKHDPLFDTAPHQYDPFAKDYQHTSVATRRIER